LKLEWLIPWPARLSYTNQADDYVPETCYRLPKRINRLATFKKILRGPTFKREALIYLENKPIENEEASAVMILYLFSRNKHGIVE
jgi:hypothetical protein